MSQKAIIIVFLLVFSATIKAQIVKKEQVVVQQTIENMFAALFNTDTASLKTFVTNNVRLDEYGQVWTIDTLIKKVVQTASTPDFKPSNYFTYVKTTIQKIQTGLRTISGRLLWQMEKSKQ